MAAKAPVYVICKKPKHCGIFQLRMVQVLRISHEQAVTDATYYVCEDVASGKQFECADYYLDLGKRFNEMEVLAWLASRS